MYTIEGTTIHRPSKMTEGNSTQYASNRTLQGVNTRDYFGVNKRTWTLEWDNINATDYATLYTIYQDYLVSGARAFQTDETNYTVFATCHVDFPSRGFTIPGSSYISSVVMTLTEA